MYDRSKLPSTAAVVKALTGYARTIDARDSTHASIAAATTFATIFAQCLIRDAEVAIEREAAGLPVGGPDV